MTNYSRTTLRELKKRYLNILKKCLLANLMMFAFSLTAHSGTATDADSLMTELEKNERTVVETGTHLLTYDKTSSLYDAESDSIIFPSVEHTGYIKVQGGRLYNNADLTFISDNELIFKENKSILTNGQGIYGGAINNAGNLTFNAKVGFLENENSSNNWTQGTVHNSGTINFNNYVRFEDNISLPLKGTVYGSSVYNSGTMNFTSADFIGNYSGEKKNPKGGQSAAIYNGAGGNITFTGIVNFENNQGWSSGLAVGGTVFNSGSIEFQQKVSFKNNTTTAPLGEYQAVGNFYNTGTGTAVFADVDFIGNEVTGTKSGTAGALFNTGDLTFKGVALFKDNKSKGPLAHAGAMYLEYGTTVFEKEALFLNNSAAADTSAAAAGAVYIGYKDSIVTFKDKVTFKENRAKGVTEAKGGAVFIHNKGCVLTFENGFHFSGNKEIIVVTDENGLITETEKLNDIYMHYGTIHIEGTNPNAEEYIGGGIRGTEERGTINKSSVATLVFGEESDSTGFTGVFNQTAGKTVAKSETFLGGTNNILGGELETHGSEILYTAVVGQNKDETTGEVLSSGTLTHLALGSEPVEIKGLSFKEEGTNLSMTFKSGTSERARYQINEDIMNATGNKLVFENSDVYVDGNKTLGTVEAKNSDIDVGTREISVDEIALKENAVLKMTVNSLAEHGKVNGVIAGTDTSKIALQLGMETESGIYQLFDRDNEVKTVGNPLFNIQDLEDGSFEIDKKTSEELSSSLSVGKNEGKALSAMMMRSAPNKEFKVVQNEVLEALQSEDKVTVENAKEALTALSGRSTSLYQSQATAGFTQLHNVVSQMLMNTAAPVFGHNGGEEPARASVYIKGLYDRVNSLTGDGFRMRSKGAVLGIQSAVTEDLTVGVGYAGVDTTVKNHFAEQKLKPTQGLSQRNINQIIGG